MSTISQRLQALREVMRREHLSAFIFPSTDPHQGEYIPYWKGKTQRERIFNHVSKEWEEAYHAGVFTEFMEQRAPAIRPWTARCTTRDFWT